MMKRVGCTGLVLLMLLLAACTPTLSDETITTNPSSEETTEMTDTNTPETPSVSRDLLTFTPASVAGQVLTSTGASPQILIENYNETAIDALGRHLPTSEEAGLPKEDKYVGLFYFLAHGIDGSHNNSNLDVTKLYAVNPSDPQLQSGRFHWWCEPETGYHLANDVWQIKRDMRYFAMAGVDFLYFDFTNGRTYDQSFRVLLDVCVELRAQGQMTPYIVPFTHGTDKHSERESADLGGLYRNFYCDEKYADLWFYWEGKPLVLLSHSVEVMRPNAYVDDTGTVSYSDYFTFRMGWSSLNWPGQSEKNYMKWNDNCVVNYGYQYGYTDDPSVAECIGIGPAAWAHPGQGRSGELSKMPYLDQFYETSTMGEGIVFENAFREVMEKNPEVKVLMISRWNEWGAAYLGVDEFGFVDQFNREFSRDLEPIKGSYTDNYFYQMCSIIRRFKGVLPADGNTGKQTMDVSGDFSPWQEIKPVFTDYLGDTSPRDDYDTSGTIHYVNNTGRNDIVETRLTSDGGMIYVYVRTAETITPHTDRNWMMLFLDTDNNKATGWEGYDFVVNYNVIDETITTLCAYKINTWQEIGVVKYQVKGNECMVAIPRSLLGLTGESMTLNFHWLDNVTDVYDLESWFTTGDSAPERRNNYSLTLKVPYATAEETVLPARSEGRMVGMPAIQLSADTESNLQKGLSMTVYNLSEKYGKMPDFEHIASLATETFSVSKINANPGVMTRKTDYALAYEGYVKIPADGDYTFRVACDDAVCLYIDGRLITEVPYDAERAADAIVSNSGSVTLTAGYHSIRIAYAEVGKGGAGLALQGEWDLFH